MPWVFVNLILYYKYEDKPCKHEKATVTSITQFFLKRGFKDFCVRKASQVQK